MRTDCIAAKCPRRSCVRLGLHADSVQVEEQTDVEGIGMVAMNISGRARVESTAPKAGIEELLLQTGGSDPELGPSGHRGSALAMDHGVIRPPRSRIGRAWIVVPSGWVCIEFAFLERIIGR